MVKLSLNIVTHYLEQGKSGKTPIEKGRALEDMICYIFGKVPGITMSSRDETNIFETEEIDIAFWNEQSVHGFYFLPFNIFVECKNWNSPVGTSEVSYFKEKLEGKGLDLGILITGNGITGDTPHLSRAHKVISDALVKKIKIIVITLPEIVSVRDTRDLVKLMKQKLCELTLYGTSFP